MHQAKDRMKKTIVDHQIKTSLGTVTKGILYITADEYDAVRGDLKKSAADRLKKAFGLF